MGSVKQDEMEKTIRGLIDQMMTGQPDRISAMIKPAFVSCDSERMTLTMKYPAMPWERNGIGILHGGITATMFDFTAGILAIAQCGQNAVTVSMQLSYLRATPVTGDIYVRASTTKSGRRLIYVNAESWAEGEPDKLLVTASCTFMA